MASARRPFLLPALALVLSLAPACGDDDGGNDDDGPAGTSLAEPTSTAAETTSSAATASSGGGDSTTGFPMECEGLCGEAEICVVPGSCSADPPSCVPAEMVICDFATGACTVTGVCSGALIEGALVCEECS